MASLTLTIGALTAQVTATDAKANAILAQYAASIGATGTNQAKANAVVLALVRHMQDQVQQYRGRVVQADATAAAEEEIAGLTWE